MGALDGFAARGESRLPQPAKLLGILLWVFRAPRRLAIEIYGGEHRNFLSRNVI
jgi:hypothetical protein